MASGGYTCITCRVAFVDPELQRSHYKTDWHRYNLKRKVAELPPVTAENFKERVLAQRAVDAVEAKHEFCQICKKHFTSENSYQSHLRSRKHKEREIFVQKTAKGSKQEPSKEEKSTDSELLEMNKKKGVDKEIIKDAEVKEEEEEEESDSDFEPEPLEISECLFCPQSTDDLELNLKHMSLVHGFFLPDVQYLVDIKGLILHLCEKVGVSNMCLYCNEKGKTFYSVEAAQHHMVDKCHCKIYFEGDAALEYAEFYDYSKSYPDYDENAKDASGVKEKEREDDSLPDSSLKVTDDLELVLPSGAKVSHRAMKQVYKQHLPTEEQRKSAVISRLMSQYRALGWKGYGGGEVGKKREKDELWVRRMEQARTTKLSIRANKFQKHFRPQVVF